MLINTRIGTKLVRSTGLVLLLVMVLGVIWNVYSQKRRAQVELLEQSRVIAEQVLALRRVTAKNQDIINYDSKGNFEFKHLNPASVVQQMSAVFNSNTNYMIRQVSNKPRRAENLADPYEQKQLEFFSKNKEINESWGQGTIEGKRYFRYMIPLYVTPSCLSCHGDPKGEIDISGHKKEGYKLGDLIGALTVSIPTKTKEASINRSIIENVLLMLAAIIFSAIVIFYHTDRFVTRPILGLTKLSKELGKGNMKARLQNINAYGEVKDLMERFTDMAYRLQEIYDHLEYKVEERTKELAAANDQLIRISSYKSEFLANMSHELRTPLTAILVFTEDLLTKSIGQLTPQQEDYLKDIHSSGKQLLGLVNDLLDLSKIESGKMSLNLTEVNVGRIAHEVKRLLQPLADEKEVTIDANILDSKHIIADEQKVKQLIQNLLGNAIKFSPPKSTVKMTVRDISEEHDGVNIIIEDKGPGISQNEQQLIFDSFYQVNKGLQKQYKGTGLGLALVKKIIDIHKGKLDLTSTEGQGSVFSVLLLIYPPLDDDLVE